MTAAFRAFAVFILWNLVVGTVMITADLAVALPVLTALTALLIWGYLLRPPAGARPQRRWATLRLRPLRGSVLGWSLAAIPVALLFSHTALDLYGRLVSVPADTLEQFRPLLETRDRRLLLTLLAVGTAPLVEEFVFRGLLQRPLERRYGTAWGISIAASAFAAIHLLPWIMPMHFLLGTMFGVAVWASRSMWTGVLLHAANNALAVVGMALSGPEPAATETIWREGPDADFWLSLLAFGITAAAAVWVARKLYRAGRENRLRAA